MRKRILTLLSFCFGISSFAFATTPYRQISGPTAYQPYGTTQHPTTYSAPYQTNNVATYTRNTGLYNPYNAHGTSRYYTPQNFDRLADSGVYLGLSAAYSNIMGDIKSDYSYFDVPGATHGADFKADSVIPFGLSVGATVNSDIRIDLSYNYYSGIHYPSNVEYDDQMYVNNVPVSGGRIKSQATMFNLYYNLESVLGNLFGGKLVPYVGVGLGISINTLSDYQIVNENDLENGDVDYDGLGTTIYYEVINPTYSYHAG